MSSILLGGGFFRCQWGNSQVLAFARRHRGGVRLLGLSLLGCLVAISPSPLRMGWVALGAGTLCSLVLLQRLEPVQSKWVRRLFLTALLTRVIVALLLYGVCPRIWYETPMGMFQNGGFFVADGYGYAANGYWLAEHWKRGEFPTPEALGSVSLSGAAGVAFDYWNGLVAYWLGYHPLTFFGVNCLFGSWAGILAYWIARLYLRERAARAAGLLTAFWPSLFLWSTQNLKEPMSFTLLLTALALFLFPFRRGRGITWAAGLGVTWVLAKVNPFIGSLFLAALLIYCVLYGVVHIRMLRVVFLAAAVFTCYSISSGKVPGPLLRLCRDVDTMVFQRAIVEQALEPNKLAGWIEYSRRVRMLDARTPFFEWVRLDTMVKVVMFLPIGLVGVLTLPAPWMARSSTELLGSLEMLLWYPLLFFAFRGATRAILGSPGQQLILTIILVFCSAMALLEGNIGTLFRHRASVWPLLLFLTALGLQREPSREAV